MSTNFYFRAAGAKDFDDKDHIGLSAADIILFRVFPRRGLTTSAAWKKFLAEDGRVIVDEYNRVWSTDEFFNLLERAKNSNRAEYKNSPELAPETKITPQIRRYRDQDGHVFCNYVFS